MLAEEAKNYSAIRWGNPSQWAMGHGNDRIVVAIAMIISFVKVLKQFNSIAQKFMKNIAKQINDNERRQI